MESPEYACHVFDLHFRHFFATSVRRQTDFQCLELGPGSSVSSCVIAKAYGCRKCVMLDSADLALTEPGIYRQLGRFLNQLGLPAPNLEDVLSVEAVLKLCNGLYLTSGLESLQKLPDRSFDFIWSHTVLQHVERTDLPATIAEMRRVIRPDGIASHVIDFRDMLTGSANHLAMPGWLWRRGFLRPGGVYTNRVLRSEMLRMFQKAGFEPQVVEQSLWTSVPVPRQRLAKIFQVSPEQDLLTQTMHVLLKPRA